MAIRNYRDLVAWQRAMELAEQVYTATKPFPPDERYVLVAQLRRSAVSVPSNIAEGQGLRSDGAFGRHLSIARGSLCELETQLLLSARLGYIDQAASDRLAALASEVGKLIAGLSHAVSLP
jgi:four helix bundle protein